MVRPTTLSGSSWQGVNYFSTTHPNPKPMLPSAPHWLQQVHGTQLYQARQPAQRVAQLPVEQRPTADAAWTTTPETVLAVYTADCLPVVIADTAGQVVGVAHAGWRGLAAGVLERLFNQLQQAVAASSTLNSSAQWQAWIGPAISQQHFEVGEEVYQAFNTIDTFNSYASFFIPISKIKTKAKTKAKVNSNKYLADLAGIAEAKLLTMAAGNVVVQQSGVCTYTEKDHYYSYRRQADTGRIATFAWLNKA